MEAAAVDSSTPSRDAASHLSPSPERSLSNLLRRRSRSGQSTMTGTPSASVDREKSSLRDSIDRGLDKLRNNSEDVERPRSSNDSSSSSRLAKLMPTKSRRKSKKKSKLPEANANADSESRGRSLGLNGLDDKLNLNASVESLRSKSGASSLLTEDSDQDNSPRPPLVSRPSHKGYLTLSSPLIAAETVEHSADAIDEANTSAYANAGDESIETISTHTEPEATLFETLSFPTLKAFSPSRADSDPAKSTIPSSPATIEATAERSNTIPRKLVQKDRAPTGTPPRTPTSVRSISINTSPKRVGTPSTFVTPPTPVAPRTPSPARVKAGSNLNLSSITSLPGLVTGTKNASPIPAPSEQITHRRTRSATTASSKLRDSSILTPHPEEAKTPGGTIVTPSASSGFFASVFSATQNAVSSIGATLTNTSLQRTRSGTTQSEPDKTGSAGGEEVFLTNQSPTTKQATEPAVKTLGAGNLSLSHLGIPESVTTSAMTTQTELSETFGRTSSASISSGQEEHSSVAQAVSAAYGDRQIDKTPVVSDNASERPRSLRSVFGNGNGNGNGASGRSTPPAGGSTTPPRSSTMDSINTHIGRSGSVRSRLSGRKNRTKRGSSGTTGHTIAAALGSSHAALANPASPPSTSAGPTGFAVANSKRNKDFHTLFKSVPEDDYLIDDYSAALQRDILLQGRLYISEKHICFSSNILGWVTNLIMSFDEVIAMEKKSTAMIFPNAIVIQTLHSKNVFASFISRDTTYDLLLGIWRITHQNITATENGHKLDDEKADGTDTASDVSPEDDSDDYDDEGADVQSSLDDHSGSSNGSEVGDIMKSTTLSNGAPASTSAVRPVESPGSNAAQELGAEFPGPSSHVPTECSDQDSHYERILMDTTIPAPLGKVYTMMFGPQSGTVMRRFLVDDQKSEDLQLNDDKKGLTEDQKTVTYTYIKPLGGSIGPKSTKCIVSQTLEAFDLEKAVSVTCSTQTPDVPSGNVFVTRTKYCLMWAPGNSTKFIANCTVEWSGKSWLKGPIEKGCNDGQIQYCKDLVAFFKVAVSSKGGKSSKGKSKGKRRRARSDAAGSTDLTHSRESHKLGSKSQSWGPFEPLHPILGPITDILGPLVSATSVMGILLFIVTILWIRASWTSGGQARLGYRQNRPQRAAVYEDLWRREESQLWDWLDDRLSLDGLTPRAHKYEAGAYDEDEDLLSRLELENMSERQVDVAVRVTAERLDSLKSIINRKRAQKAD